jgi:hypothetical protein
MVRTTSTQLILNLSWDSQRPAEIRWIRMVGDHLYTFGHEELVNSGGHVDWGTVSKCRNQSWDISGMDGFTPADVVQAGD